jgi:hypothetical protein
MSEVVGTTKREALEQFEKIYEIYGENLRTNLTMYYLPQFFDQLGHFLSCKNERCLAYDGSPQPWYSYPAIEYIRNLDLRARRVFEYGTGMSTFFYASRAASVTSVEDNAEWANLIRSQKPGNVEIKHREETDAYINAVREDGFKYDIIVVDGLARRRCAEAALSAMHPDGLIILDNSDTHIKAAEVLRNADLLQVDLSGFAPLNWVRQTTSFFFSRSFRAKPLNNVQPAKGVGMQSALSDD